MIVNPITKDERIGFDKFGQLMCRTVDGPRTTWTFVADVRDATCAICDRGWELNGESFSDQMGWSLVDATVHRSCLIRHEALSERAEVFEALVGARVRFELSAIDNRYWPPPDPWSKKPWYRARLLDHPLVAFAIGVRKRVWEVAVEGACPWHGDAERDFAAEQVTKHFAFDSIHVHAWGRYEMRSYVRRLAAIGRLCVTKEDHVSNNKRAQQAEWSCDGRLSIRKESDPTLKRPFTIMLHGFGFLSAFETEDEARDVLRKIGKASIEATK